MGTNVYIETISTPILKFNFELIAFFSLKSCFQPTKSQSTIRHKSSACSQFFKGPIKFFCNAKDKEVKCSAKEDRRKWLKERATTAKKANENGRNKELW